MSELLFELPLRQAETRPDAPAIMFKGATTSYGEFAGLLQSFARFVVRSGLAREDRVAVYLPKQLETVVTMFGAACAGCAFVPVNPILKPQQVEHILNDCGVRLLVTSPERLAGLAEMLPRCAELRHVIVTGEHAPREIGGFVPVSWSEVVETPASGSPHRVIDTDMVSIFYTSGSTGRPKGVVLSHRNMVTGAHSVARYLGNHAEDRLLAVLPFSFDYGFSQLSTAFHVGASVSLMDYFFARDILSALERDRITGLAGVPPLWAQLADLVWPDEATRHLRYLTNSGGAMPGTTLAKLRKLAPRAEVFLMYGLTEAFRSTYLPPAEIDRRPGSMGKAIPNAEILVVRPDGTPCAPNEPGELVHRGSLVALGYWNDPVKTAERFRPAPGRPAGLMLTEMAVWSGDTVRTDEEGFLYFIGRRDEMIKTSGYRVSPTEVEEVAFASGLVRDAAAVGVPHPALGQAIVLVAAPAPDRTPDDEPLLIELRKTLPAFMVPARIEWRDDLPRNANGKYDRALLARELSDLFAEAAIR